MTVDSVTSPELLAAELAAIEDLLQNYEDWRAWAQLEARERQGELPPAVAASGLKTLLLDKLANNTLFLRRQALVKQLEHVNAQARSRPRAPDEADDLTRIRGIDVRLERRLNNLAVRSWHQIAHWTPADVHYFASTLGLGDLIARDQWIEQAALLSGLAPRASAAPPIAHRPPPQPQAMPVVQPPPAVAPPPQAAVVAPAVPLPDPEVAAPVANTAPPPQQTAPQQPAVSEPAPAAVAASPPAPTPTSAPAETSPAVPQPEAAQARQASVTEPEYQLDEPARPLPASAYTGYVPQPPSAPPLDRAVLPLKTAAMGAAAIPPHAPEPSFAALEPPTGAPAWYYEGAVVEPPHDLPGCLGHLSPWQLPDMRSPLPPRPNQPLLPQKIQPCCKRSCRLCRSSPPNPRPSCRRCHRRQRTQRRPQDRNRWPPNCRPAAQPRRLLSRPQRQRPLRPRPRNWRRSRLRPQQRRRQLPRQPQRKF